MDFKYGFGIDPGLGTTGFNVRENGNDHSFTVDMGLFTIKTALETILEIINYDPGWQVLVAIELPGTGTVESRGHTFERCDVSRSMAEMWADACANIFGPKVLIQNVRPGERRLIKCGNRSFKTVHERDAYQILQCALGEKPIPPTRREKNAFRRLRESGRKKETQFIHGRSNGGDSGKYRLPHFYEPESWRE